MGTPITSVNVAEAIVKLVAARGLPALVGNLVMGKLVNLNYEPVLANAGDTVNVPIPPTMAANNIAEGGNVNLQNPTLGNAQIVLNNHVESSFAIQDIATVLTGSDNGDFSLLDKYMAPAMISVAESVETYLLNLYPGFTINPSVGTGNTALLESVIDSAETALFNAKVPEGLARYLVVDGNGYSQLRQIERFTEDRMDANGQAIVSGQLGRIKNFATFRSQYIPKTGSTTHGLAFASDAIALATRRLPMPMPGTGAIATYAEMGNFGMRIVMSYNANVLSQQFTVDILYGAAVLRNQFAVPVLY